MLYLSYLLVCVMVLLLACMTWVYCLFVISRTLEKIPKNTDNDRRFVSLASVVTVIVLIITATTIVKLYQLFQMFESMG